MTSPKGKSRGRGSLKPGSPDRAVTTEPGFRNPNGQVVVRRTGAPSSVRDRQVVYELRCGCGHRYGCNGLDIKERKCPYCSGGAPGELLQEAPPRLW